MGIFPIFMNVLQFWLIDSIVKASANTSPLALPTDSARSSLDPDNEPLFRGGSDDEDDDDGHPARYDLENPRPKSRSPSRSVRTLSPSTEHKSLASGSVTVVGSGSTTPTPKPIDTTRKAAHAYPPSLASASSSPVSSISSSSTSSSRGRGRRRSPPPPLALHDIPVSQDVLPVGDDHDDEHNEKEWSAWGDEESEDWAERVGEEDWTGRRLEDKRYEVNNAWSGQGQVSAGMTVSAVS